jgi:type I restriction enzyme M protein
MSSNHSGEGNLPRAIIEAAFARRVVAPTDRFFYSTEIPICLSLFTKNKAGKNRRPHHYATTIFINARKKVTLIDRVHRDLTYADLENQRFAYMK